MTEKPNWVSRCVYGIKSLFHLETVKDFKMPIGMTAAAIALSAISMGLSLEFIPVISHFVGNSLEKRKEKKLTQMAEKERNDLLKELATKIDNEMKSNEKLRQEVATLLADAMESKEFTDYLKQNQELSKAIDNKISILVDAFPDLKKDLGVVHTKIDDIMKTMESIKKTVQQESISRGHYKASFWLGANLVASATCADTARPTLLRIATGAANAMKLSVMPNSLLTASKEDYIPEIEEMEKAALSEIEFKFGRMALQYYNLGKSLSVAITYVNAAIKEKSIMNEGQTKIMIDVITSTLSNAAAIIEELQLSKTWIESIKSIKNDVNNTKWEPELFLSIQKIMLGIDAILDSGETRI